MTTLWKENGFDSEKEFFELVASVDISSQEKCDRFKVWQYDDGSKAGLLKVIEVNNGKSGKQS